MIYLCFFVFIFSINFVYFFFFFFVHCAHGHDDDKVCIQNTPLGVFSAAQIAAHIIYTRRRFISRSSRNVQSMNTRRITREKKSVNTYLNGLRQNVGGDQ